MAVFIPIVNPLPSNLDNVDSLFTWVNNDINYEFKCVSDGALLCVTSRSNQGTQFRASQPDELGQTGNLKIALYANGSPTTASRTFPYENVSGLSSQYLGSVPTFAVPSGVTYSPVVPNGTSINSNIINFVKESFTPEIQLSSYPQGSVTFTKISGDYITQTFIYRVTADNTLYSGIALSVANLQTDIGIPDVTVTTIYNDTDYEFSFTMPVEGAKIVANAEKKSYNIIYSSSQFGNVTGASTKKWGETVTVTATPNAGYTTVGILVTKGQESIDVTRTGDTTFTFVMPVGNVTVSASYNKKLSVIWNVRPASLGNVVVDGISEYRKATDAPTHYTTVDIDDISTLSIYTDADVYWGRVTEVFEGQIYFASRSQFTIYFRNVVEIGGGSSTSYYSITASSIDDSTGINLYKIYINLSNPVMTNLPAAYNSASDFMQAAANRVVNGAVKIYEPNSTVSFRVETLTSYEVSTISINNNSVEYDFNRSTGVGSFIMPNVDTDVIVYIALDRDPNDEGGTSTPENIPGNYDSQSDNIGIPTLPSTGIAYDVPVGQGVGKGILTIYNPTLSQLNDLGDWLYANSVQEGFWNGLRNIFANPMDSIISLHIIPFTPTRGVNTHNIGLGILNTFVPSYIVSNQYKDIDLGTLEIKPFWNSYLDFSPYTKMSLFLPYIGSVEINPDIVMGEKFGILYRCDVLTGGCVAYLYTKNEAGIKSIFGEYSGSMALSLPLTGSDFSQMVSGFISAISSVALMKGAGSAALVTNATSNIAEARSNVLSAKSSISDAYAMPRQLHIKGVRGSVSNVEARNNAIENAENAYASAKESLAMARGKKQGIDSLVAATQVATVPYTVGRIMGSKMSTTISGTITGGLGLLGSQKPYLIITRPRQSLANNYVHYHGYPSNMYVQLKTLSGFTKVEQIVLENVPCTDEELATIIAGLKEGVYI